MTLEGLSSFCAQSEPASSKNNEILKINGPAKFYIACSFSNSVCIMFRCITGMIKLTAEANKIDVN